MANAPSFDKVKIAVIGLGYVGLPLAVHLSRKLPIIGFDIDARRVDELKGGHDRTRECTTDDLKSAKHLSYETAPNTLKTANFFIVTVPTPIDAAKRPDLSPLEKSSAMIGKVIQKGTVVVYELTVYPGATEEVCVPIIEMQSGLKYNVDFFAGYSPERINPADHARPFPKIKKMTSGSTPEVAELAQLFKRMGLETREVLEAAETKWNFHYYRPGLVGGHCIGPHKAQELGFHPEMILAGRRINDGMANYIAQDIIKTMLQKKLRVDCARVLMMGITFKQNCPDIRNTKIADLVRELEAFGHSVTIFDSLADPDEVFHEYRLKTTRELPTGTFDTAVLAVKHDEIAKLGPERIRSISVPGGLVYDVKEILDLASSDALI